MRSPAPTCGCPYRWGNYGRLYGVSMGEGWIRTDTDSGCVEHGDYRPPVQPPGSEQVGRATLSGDGMPLQRGISLGCQQDTALKEPHMMTIADLVHIARSETITPDTLDLYGNQFDGNLYTWACPTCQAVPNTQYPRRQTAERGAETHLQECPGTPIAPHRHPNSRPACYAIHAQGTPRGAEIDPTELVAVELYRTPQPYTDGTPLEEWDGSLDDSSWEWLRSQGYDGNVPDLWVNIVPANAWTPNNRPINYRFALPAADA